MEIDLTLPEYENRYHRKDQWLYLICNSFRNKNRYHILQIRSMASFDLQFVLEQEQISHSTDQINGFIWFAIRSRTRTDITFYRSDQWLHLICNSFRNKNRYHILQIRSMASFDLQFVLEQEQALQTTYKINGFIWFAIRSRKETDIAYYRSDQWLYLICNSFCNKNRYYILQIRWMALFDLQFVPEKNNRHYILQIRSMALFD